MAWKLKKSKVDDSTDSAGAASSVVVTHGHQGAKGQPDQSDDTDFFGSTLDDIDQTITNLKGARVSDSTDFEAGFESVSPRSADIPIVQSAFVTAKPNETSASDPTDNMFDATGIESKRVDFDDVDFDLDREPETVDFDTHIDSDFSVAAPAKTVDFDTIPTVADHVDTVTAEDHAIETNDVGIGAEHLFDEDDEDDEEEKERTIIALGPTDEPVVQAPAIAESDLEAMNKTVVINTPVAPEPVASVTMPEPAVQPEAVAAPEPVPVAAETAPIAPVAPTIPITPKVTAPTKLVVKIGPFAAEYDLTIAGDELLIGRPDYNTGETPPIAIELDDAISRRHARIIRVDGVYRVEDLGSKNGTLINGQPLMPNVSMPFNIGDVVRVGERTEISLRP